MTETKTKVHIGSVEGFRILCLKSKTHRCFDRTTERKNSFLFTYVNDRGKQGETFFVAQDIAETVLNESLELPKQYKVAIDFQMNITHTEKIQLVENMRRYGGNFVSKLADALIAADPSNTDRLLAAFPDVVNKYTEKAIRISVDICAQLSDNPPWDQGIPGEKIFSIAEEVLARFDSAAIYDQIDSIACAVLRERGMGPKEENDCDPLL